MVLSLSVPALLLLLLSPQLTAAERRHDSAAKNEASGDLQTRQQDVNQIRTVSEGDPTTLTMGDGNPDQQLGQTTHGTAGSLRSNRRRRLRRRRLLQQRTHTGSKHKLRQPHRHRAKPRRKPRVNKERQVESRRSNQLPEFYRSGGGARDWVRACYLSTGLPIDKLDPTLCTHLLSFFGSLTDDGELTVVPAYRPKVAALTRMRDERNPSLRVLVSTGGSNDKFAYIASNITTRVKFAKSVVRLLDELHLDGVDLDWEFPAFMRPVKERSDFTKLLLVLKSQLKSMSPPRLLTVAVGAPASIVLASYDVPGIASAVDFVSIMAYDYHLYRAYLPATGYNTPVYASAQDDGFLSNLNVNYSAHLWLELGLPPDQLLLGIATYGISWKLRDPSDHGLYSPASGVYGSGDTTLADVCELMNGNGTRVWDPFSLVPYVYSGYEWVSYDDSQSVAAKATLVRSLDVAGAMTFILDCDDWGDECGMGEFPLHNVVREILPSLGDV